MSTNVPAGSTSEQDTSHQTEMEVLDEPKTGEETNESEKSTEEAESEEATGDDTGETTDESEEEESGDESEEIEDTDEEVDDTQEEEDLEAASDDTKIDRPSWKLIKEKYPELAKNKDFKNLFHRDAAMSEIFPTVKDAREAVGRSEAFIELDRNLVDGNLDPVLERVNKDVLAKVADKFLPSLAKIDEKMFQRATRPWLVDVLNNVLEIGEKTGDDNLKKSVRNVCRILTGSSDIPKRMEIASESPEVKAEVDKLRQETARLYQKDNRKFLSSVDFIAMKQLEKAVANGIDPKNELTPFLRQTIIEKVIRDVNRKLEADEGLLSKARVIHQQAARAGFPDHYKSRLVSATLDRAKRLIPGIRDKYKSEALRKQPPKIEKQDKEVTSAGGTKETKTVGGKITSAKQIDMGKTSPMDLLNGKVTFKS